MQSVTSVGQNAWEDRIAAEKEVDRWLSEYPSTFITVTGPPGSGKVSLVNRVLKKTQKSVYTHTSARKDSTLT